MRTYYMAQFSSVAQSCPTLCNPMNCSRLGLPVHHQLPETTQVHVHSVGDAIQSSHPLSSPSPPAFNLSQNQGFSSESAIRIRWPKCWSFSFSISPSMNIQDWFPSEWTGWISLLSKGLSRVFSNTTVQKHQFFGAQYYTSNRMAKPKKVDNSKCRRRCRTLTHCWWEYLMVWLFGKSVSTSLQS